MPSLKIGIQLASLPYPLKKGLQTCARLGASAVEIDLRGPLRDALDGETAIRDFRKRLGDLNLSVCAASFRTRRGYDVADDLERRVEATRAAMQVAYKIGATLVINQVGRVPAESSGPGWDMLTAVLSELGRYGQRVGASLIAETGSESGADLARLLQALPEQTIGVNFDPGNLVVNGYSVRESLAALRGQILHVHAKDAVRDLAQGRGVEVELGRGSVDFPWLLGTLEEQGYRGYYTIERHNARDPEGEISTAVEYLRSVG